MEKRKSAAGLFCFVFVDVLVVRAIGSVVGSRCCTGRTLIEKIDVKFCDASAACAPAKPAAALDDATIAHRETRHERWKSDLRRGNWSEKEKNSQLAHCQWQHRDTHFFLIFTSESRRNYIQNASSVEFGIPSTYPMRPSTKRRRH